MLDRFMWRFIEPTYKKLFLKKRARQQRLNSPYIDLWRGVPIDKLSPEQRDNCYDWIKKHERP